MSAIEADPGSYRDAAGTVYRVGDRILRTVRDCAAEDFDLLRGSGLQEDLSADGRLVRADPVNPDTLGVQVEGVRYVLQHPRLPFISYPYEWSFALLKCAALHHLDVHLAALDRGLTLSDAAAYNIQFQGVRPTFIDTLSFRRYRDGEFWAGYGQFCEQFLNPLLLSALLGVPHNAWYRGNFEGIPTRDLRRLLPLRAYVSRKVLIHVVLHAALGSSDLAAEDLKGLGSRTRGLPLAPFRKLLVGLRAWIAGLKPGEGRATYWRDYESFRTYTAAEVEAKKAFIAQFVEAVGPAMVWDVGCNAGEFALAALDAGAGYVVGWDTDLSALGLAFERARESGAAFTPLYGNAANPAPAQGWAQVERGGWAERGPADAVFVLAVVHHLAIANNVPLDKVVAWVLSLAPVGVVEFVGKDDPQVQRLLSLRRDIFAGYSLESFLAILRAQARIVKTDTLEPGGRVLVWFDAREYQARG